MLLVEQNVHHSLSLAEVQQDKGIQQAYLGL